MPSGSSPRRPWDGAVLANRDFRDLFAELNAAGADYLLVGAHALAVHGHLRATKDLDVWVRPDETNARRVLAALSSFGAPTNDLSAADLAAPGTIFQIGVPPVRIGVLSSIDGVMFDEAWMNRLMSQYDDQPVAVISKADLIRNKRASGRMQDLADIEALER